MQQQDNAPKRKSGLPRLIEIAGTKKWWLFASMLLAVLATVAQFVPVVIVYEIINELAAHAADRSGLDSGRLWQLGLWSLAAFGLFGVLLYTSSMLSHIAAFNILYEIRVQIAEKLPTFSIGFFSKKASGEINKVMADDVEQIENFVAHHIPDITSAVVFPLIVIAYMFYVDWRLAAVALIPFPVGFGLMMTVMMSPRSKQAYRDNQDALEAMSAAVVEYVRAMPVVKVFGNTVDSFQRLTDSVFAHRDHYKKVSLNYSKIYPAFLTIASSSLLFIVPVAILLLYRTEDQAAFIPTILFFTIIGGGFFFPLLKLTFMAGLVNQITVGVERIDDILYRDAMPDSDSGQIPADASVEFDDVTFAYDRVTDDETAVQATVLKDVSFRAEPDTVTALVGPSGAGKTTMGLLIARFWDVQSGTIRIGGVDVRDIPLKRLMNHVSFVFQDSFLFFDTIEENIRMGNAKATLDEVMAAAKAAQCHEFIENLPDGYQTLVGEGGTYLSGGEQQRVSVARAILKDTPIIVLDEATAYADPENEGKMLDGLARLIKDKTVIIIAHRLSTITNADQILVIDNGSIVEEGVHLSLVASGGLYSSMWEIYSQARTWTLMPKGAAL
ncbi:MAG: ABC transporter ATP-binding protein [Chloroflexota bacterium]